MKVGKTIYHTRKEMRKMIETMDLFATSNCDFEEEQREKEKQRAKALAIEKWLEERRKFFEKELTDRQINLYYFLEQNYVKGKMFTIEEICGACIGYELNKNPKSHDKCITLGQDIKKINYAIAERYKIIIKDRKTGSCKICENQQEFESWRDYEKSLLDKKWQYLNNLKWKADQDNTMNLFDETINKTFMGEDL